MDIPNVTVRVGEERYWHGRKVTVTCIAVPVTKDGWHRTSYGWFESPITIEWEQNGIGRCLMQVREQDLESNEPHTVAIRETLNSPAPIWELFQKNTPKNT